MDDFGNGYNYFHYLMELHLDYENRRGFVRNILNAKVDYAFVRNLSRLCQDIGTQTVVEFVEPEEILEAMRDCEI